MSISERAITARRPHEVEGLPEHERPISEQFRIVARQWVDADAAASLLEELKTTTLERMKSDLIRDAPSLADNAATRIVKSKPEWEKYIRDMCGHREKANRLKMQLEYFRIRHREWVGADATARQEMKLG